MEWDHTYMSLTHDRFRDWSQIVEYDAAHKTA